MRRHCTLNVLVLHSFLVKLIEVKGWMRTAVAPFLWKFRPPSGALKTSPQQGSLQEHSFTDGYVDEFDYFFLQCIHKLDNMLLPINTPPNFITYYFQKHIHNLTVYNAQNLFNNPYNSIY